MGETDRLRLDKWLWFARIVKTRTLAAKLIESGSARINSIRVEQAHRPVRPGDVITLAVHDRVRVLEVTGLPTRRGPAPEAASHYIDRSPAPPPRWRGEEDDQDEDQAASG
jgi:ribosome-associated heat shock protein Hsp15